MMRTPETLRSAVTLAGMGFTGKVWVDGEEAHAVNDVPLLGRVPGQSSSSPA